MRKLGTRGSAIGVASVHRLYTRSDIFCSSESAKPLTKAEEEKKGTTYLQL